MQNNPDAHEDTGPERSPRLLPSDRESTIPPYSLESPASDTPISTNLQTTSFYALSPPDARREASVSTEGGTAAAAWPLIAPNEGGSRLIDNSNTHGAAASNTINYNDEETETGIAQISPSEHSSGSDAAWHCSVGSPSSEEAMPSGSLHHASEENLGLVPASTPTSVPALAPATTTSTSTPGVTTDNAIEGESGAVKGTKGGKKKRFGKVRKSFRQLFSRKDSRGNGGGGTGVAN